MKVRTRTPLAIAALCLGLVAVAVGSLRAIRQVEVNGPLYQRLVEGKDLVADILPPPAYAIEAHFVILEMEREPDTAKRTELTRQLASLRASFDERQDYWSKLFPDGALHSALEDSALSGREFFRVIDQEYLPALSAGDGGKRSLALSQAAVQFAKHRDYVMRLVDLTNTRNTAIEEHAKAEVRSRTIEIVGLTICSATKS